MPLSTDDLVAISSLTQYAYTDLAQTVVPDIVIPAEPLNGAAPLNRVPYQKPYIDFIGPGEFNWIRLFQNPSQRVIIELEIFFGARAPELEPPDLSAMVLNLVGFDKAVILCAPDDVTENTPNNYRKLTIKSGSVVPTYRNQGRRTFLDGSGLVVIPLTIIAVSSSPLRTGETARQLTASLLRINTAQTVYQPVITGRITITPLVSARDTDTATGFTGLPE